MKAIIVIFTTLFVASLAWAETIEVVIPQGTGEASWNMETTMIQAQVGDVLVFVNQDDIPHQLHTSGAPCEHGEKFLPGETWTCPLDSKYSAEVDGFLYDHQFGKSSRLWLKVTE